MPTNRTSPNSSQPISGGVNILGLLFFLLGAPHVYSALKRQPNSLSLLTATPYAAIVVLAGVIATVIELSLLLKVS